MLVARALEAMIRIGQLTVVDATGRVHRFGPGGRPAMTMRLHDPQLHWALFFRPSYWVGEAFTRGTLTVENGSIYDLLDFFARNMALQPEGLLQQLGNHAGRMLRWLDQCNSPRRARRNAAYHYDRSDGFYGLFLDPSRQYSCAYFINPEDTLEAAQEQKMRHIAAKLLITPGMRVLDIGAGSGGLGVFLAERLGAQVTGLSLSAEQVNAARNRAAQAGLGDRTCFLLRDYREETGTYDRIVSVGMFEHVGVPHYPAFFSCLRERLHEDGVALLHTIGRSEGPGFTDTWTLKRIFPGGYIPALSEVLRAIERSGLLVTDIEVWRLHYAETLRCWRENFVARRRRAEAEYGERLLRMWEFYLASAEIAFRYLRRVVFQIQIARRIDAVPLTRDYIREAECALPTQAPQQTCAA